MLSTDTGQSDADDKDKQVRKQLLEYVYIYTYLSSIL